MVYDKLNRTQRPDGVHFTAVTSYIGFYDSVHTSAGPSKFYVPLPYKIASGAVMYILF